MAHSKTDDCPKGKEKKNEVPAEEAFQMLKAGNRRFLENKEIQYQDQAGRADFVCGQEPYAVIVTCADSRVSPEVIFNTGLDELFVIRVAGNAVDSTALASIEYAVLELETELIVILGHSSCGAISLGLKGSEATWELGYHVNALLAHFSPAIHSAQKKKKKEFAIDPVKTTVRENARLTAHGLHERSSIIAKDRGVQIAWGYYDIISGEVDLYRIGS